MEVETDVPLAIARPPGVEVLRRLSGKPEYEEILARQWPKWIGGAKSEEGDLMEALVEISLKGGGEVYVHVLGRVTSMSLPEVLVAATINAAASLKLSETHGSIEKGKFGDLLVVDAPSWEHLIYQFGNSAIISAVVKKGQIVHSNVAGGAEH